MNSDRFSFERYVEQRKNPMSGRDVRTGFADYAFAGDLRVLRRLNQMRPVRLVAESTVRFWKNMQRSELLGQCVKISRRQFPELYETVTDCAAALHIPVPTVYVAQDLARLNAGTYGTEEESFIVINSALIDRFDPQELKFVVGHECGHIQNQHVVFRTAAEFLKQGLGLTVVKWAAQPASIALNAWSRRGEITCDRAGLICCGDLEVATRSMLKLAVGSNKLMEEMDVEEYLHQLDDLREGLGRFQEFFHSHPYIPKRIRALRLFVESSYYRTLTGERGGGRPLDEVDREVEQIVQVV